MVLTTKPPQKTGDIVACGLHGRSVPKSRRRVETCKSDTASSLHYYTTFRRNLPESTFLHVAMDKAVVGTCPRLPEENSGRTLEWSVLLRSLR